MNYSLPPLNSRIPVLDLQETLTGYGNWPAPWANWITQSWQIIADIQNSGPTANRPTENLYIGKPYFDTSLGTKGKPIWLGADEATWVLADGTAA